MCLILWTVALALLPPRLGVPSAASPAVAATTIDAHEVARHVGILVADPMQGRDTPSRGLERAAAYVANQFDRMGLRPSSEGTWLHRYVVPPQLDAARSRISFVADKKTATAGFAAAAWLAPPIAPPSPVPLTDVVLVTGKHFPESLAMSKIDKKIVLYVAAERSDPVNEQPLLARLRQASRGVVILSRLDSAAFAGNGISRGSTIWPWDLLRLGSSTYAWRRSTVCRSSSPRAALT